MEEINTGDVIIVHLTSGQTIVGRGATATTSAEEGLLLDKPYELMGGQRPDGSLGFGMQPYLAMGGLLPAFEHFCFEWPNIVIARECPLQITNAYLQLSSGIEIARTVPETGQGRTTSGQKLLVVP